MTSFTAYNRGFRSRVMKGEKRKKGLTRGWRNQVPGTEWMEGGQKGVFSLCQCFPFGGGRRGETSGRPVDVEEGRYCEWNRMAVRAASLHPSPAATCSSLGPIRSSSRCSRRGAQGEWRGSWGQWLGTVELSLPALFRVHILSCSLFPTTLIGFTVVGHRSSISHCRIVK